MAQRMSICDLLQKREENETFKIMIGNKKRSVYNNMKGKDHGEVRRTTTNNLQTTFKGVHHSKNMMLPIWWNQKGAVSYEFLAMNKTINWNVYYAYQRSTGSVQNLLKGCDLSIE